jgi:hypothetical protein
MDNDVGVTDEAGVRSVAGIDFKSTRSALLTSWGASSGCWAASFQHLRTEMLDLDPPAACVLGHLAPADDGEPLARPPAPS